MLKSMTGFGIGIAESALGVVKVEVKSLNYKFFEVVTRLPGNLTIFEDKIREYLQQKISRGRLNLFLTYDKKGGGNEEICIDKKVAKQYYNKIIALKKELALAGSINIEHIISLPGVLAYRPNEDNAGKLWPLISKALAEAAKDLIRSKAREGKMLKKNIMSIIASAETSLGRIRERAPIVGREYKKRLQSNIKELTGERRPVNPEKIEEEAAIFARNCDISEEIHRTYSHIAGFRKILSHNGEAGRRLDFIAQEMHREANTMGAKANDFPISKEVIKIKSMIDKIREQVQNVE